MASSITFPLAGDGPAALPRSPLARLRSALVRARTRAVLASLSEELLRDLGLTRADVARGGGAWGGPPTRPLLLGGWAGP